MKETVLILAIFFISFLGCQSALAQAISEVHLHFEEIMEIQISEPNVGIPMNTAEHFIAGNETTLLRNHVTATSTVAYSITLKAEESVFSFNGISSAIPVNSIHVETSLGSGPGFGNPIGLEEITTPLVLSDVNQEVVLSSELSIQQNFDVNYRIPSSETGNFLNRSSGEYKALLTYSIIPH